MFRNHRTEIVQGASQRIDNAAQQRFADRHVEHPSAESNLAAGRQVTGLIQQHHADFSGVEIEDQSVAVALKLQKFLAARRGQPAHASHPMSQRMDGSDLLGFETKPIALQARF